jgi:hypothetical protein
MKTNSVNKMPLYPIIIVLVIFLYAGSCDKPPLVERFYSIEITNSSVDTICPYLALGEGLTQYPDTTLPSDRPALVKIAPNKRFYYDSRKTWNQRIDELAADTLSIFIIDAGVYRDSSWSVIRDQYLILKRFDLSVDDLKSINWKVSYP